MSVGVDFHGEDHDHHEMNIIRCNQLDRKDGGCTF